MSELWYALTGPFVWWAGKLKYQLKMLKHRPRLLWHKLFIREDEFDKSLDMDGYAMMDMNKEDRKKYLNDLSRRRRIAHEQDMEND